VNRLLCLVLAGICISSAQAHQPDTGYLTIRIGQTEIGTEYSADVLTLLRLCPSLDANNDGAISRDEGESSRPIIHSYLRQHLFVDLEGREAGLGDPQPLRWPIADLSPIPRADWHQLLLSFPFRLTANTSPSEVQVTCDVFIELGLTHKIIGEFQVQDQVRHPVVFTLEEPDYRFNVTHALARIVTDRPSVPPNPHQLQIQVVRQGIISCSRPGALLLLLALLVAAPPRRAAMLVAMFALGQLGTAIPVTLSGSPLAPRWLHFGQSLAVISAASLNLWPGHRTDRRSVQLALSFGCGLLQGLASGAITRETCLHPLNSLTCLGSFQSGANLALICAASALAAIFAALGVWRPGSLLPRTISAATLIAGIALLLGLLQ